MGGMENGGYVKWGSWGRYYWKQTTKHSEIFTIREKNYDRETLTWKHDKYHRYELTLFSSLLTFFSFFKSQVYVVGSLF